VFSARSLRMSWPSTMRRSLAARVTFTVGTVDVTTVSYR
jgi:hypothetical protein